MSENLSGHESFETKSAGIDTSQISLEKAINTEDALLIGANTMAGIGIGFVAIALGSTVIGAVIEATLIPTLLAKVAGAIAGGGAGLARGISSTRKDKARRKRSVHFV